MLKLNKTILNNQWVKEGIARNVFKYFEKNKKKDTHIKSFKYFLDEAKPVLKGNLQL